MERRTITDGEEPEREEEHQHRDARGHRICREVAPLIVSAHAP
jgi:hypothetical protein